jgi:hypothetical protein
MKRLAAALLLATTVVILYRKAIRLWWLYDDTWLLHVTLARRWTMAFTDGDTWHRTFTPLLDSTYEALFAFAGMETMWWHVAELTLVAACAWAIFLVLQLYLPSVPAFAGAFLFVAGAPLCAFATQLTLVHILEALFLATLSTASFVAASRRASNAWNAISALLYFAAVLADRTMLALPLLLLVLPERTWRIRARHLVFHALAFLGLVLWRGFVLGFFIGGPGWALNARDAPAALAMLPWKIAMTWFGSSIEAGLVAVAVIVIGAVRALRGRSAILVALVPLLLAIAPILGSKDVGPRQTMPAWLWLCVLFAIGMTRMKTVAANALFVGAAAALLVANRQEWGEVFARSERMSDEARAFMIIDGASMLRAPAIPPAAMGEMKWLKEDYFRRALGSGWFYDDLYLCGTHLNGRRVFEYHPVRREVLEVTSRIPDFARGYCSQIRDKVPLRAEFHHRRDSLFWRFGPYPNGRWRVVLGGGVQAYDVPREDGFSLPGVPGLALRVRYQSPEGWVTYSPELTLDFAKQPELVWTR